MQRTNAIFRSAVRSSTLSKDDELHDKGQTGMTPWCLDSCLTHALVLVAFTRTCCAQTVPGCLDEPTCTMAHSSCIPFSPCTINLRLPFPHTHRLYFETACAHIRYLSIYLSSCSSVCTIQHSLHPYPACPTYAMSVMQPHAHWLIVDPNEA